MPLGVRPAACVAACLVLTALYGSDKPITVGVVIDGATEQQRAPLLDYLRKVMGRPVLLAAPDSYRDTVDNLGAGSYDFACLGALMYIRARARYGVIPLVQRVGDLHYHSVFITATNSPIHSINDLKGTQFAFGDIDSTSAHLMAYQELKQAGIDPETDLKYRYSGSHLATAALVANGAVDAGAIDETVYDYLISTGKLDPRKVRVFFTSSPYVDYVYVARRDMPQEDRARFAAALLALKAGPDDAILAVLRAEKYVLANDAEYAATRKTARALGMF